MSILILLLGIYEFIDSYGDYEVLAVLAAMSIPLLILGIMMIKKPMNSRKACERLHLNDNYVTAEVVSVCRDKRYASCIYYLYHILSGIGIAFVVLKILLFSIKRNKKKMQVQLWLLMH